MISYNDFKNNRKKDEKSSVLKESSNKKISKKKLNENKMVNAKEDTPKTGDLSNSIRFLKNSNHKPIIEATENIQEEIQYHTNEIIEEESQIHTSQKINPVVNEGFLSREFVEGFIGRPLNNSTQKTNNTPPPAPPPQFQQEAKRDKVKEEEYIKKEVPKEEKKEDSKSQYEEEEFEEPVYEEPKNNFNGYRIYRDKLETFECRIHVEGSTLNNTKVRLLLESNEWNSYFNGKMTPDGKCVIPLKKMSILPEGLKGTIMLEVTVEDTVFYPWKETFQVESSKKVKVDILSGKDSKNKGPKVRVSGI